MNFALKRGPFLETTERTVFPRLKRKLKVRFNEMTVRKFGLVNTRQFKSLEAPHAEKSSQFEKFMTRIGLKVVLDEFFVLKRFYVSKANIELQLCLQIRFGARDLLQRKVLSDLKLVGLSPAILSIGVWLPGVSVENRRDHL